MSMNEADRDILIQMLDLCNKVESRVIRYGIDENRFVEDDALFDMLLMPIFQLGELVGALSDSFVVSHGEIPWHAIRGFRNIIGHDYGVVDPLWAWNTVQSDIPALRDYLKTILAS